MEVFFLSRLARNRQRRRRQRMKICFIIGLLLCICILLGGILIINDTMMRVTSLPEERDMLSMDNIRRSTDEIAYTIGSKWMRIEDKIASFYDNVVQWLRDIGQAMVDIVG